MLQASPEFKGIKTCSAASFSISAWLQASPEFKGIKTYTRATPRHKFSFKPALNSKGLRLDFSELSERLMLQASPEFKGIKTLCNPDNYNIRLQASPEFKGIKTIIS